MMDLQTGAYRLRSEERLLSSLPNKLRLCSYAFRSVSESLCLSYFGFLELSCFVKVYVLRFVYVFGVCVCVSMIASGCVCLCVWHQLE